MSGKESEANPFQVNNVEIAEGREANCAILSFFQLLLKSENESNLMKIVWNNHFVLKENGTKDKTVLDFQGNTVATIHIL